MNTTHCTRKRQMHKGMEVRISRPPAESCLLTDPPRRFIGHQAVRF